MSQKFYDLEISKVKRQTNSAVAISFNIPADLKDNFSYKNGQYITVKKKLNAEEVRRSYSLCSDVDEDFTIAVKEVKGGAMSPILNQVKAGDVLSISEPEGNFTLSKHPAKLYLYAGGSGITPVLSILKRALKDNISVTLVYANTEASEIIFHEDIKALKETNSNKLELIHFLEKDANNVAGAHSGRINRALFEKLSSETPFKAGEHFICGPGPMMKFIESSLKEFEVAEEHINLEYFEAPEENLEDTSAGFSGNSQVKIILDDEVMEIEVNEKESILSALLREGVDAPYSCQGGVCATCRALVSEGEVYLSQNLGITEGEIAEGYTLTCSSYPRSPKLTINYDEA